MGGIRDRSSPTCDLRTCGHRVVMREDDPGDGPGFPSSFSGVVHVHPERRGGARYREDGSTDRPVELEFLQTEDFAVEVPRLADIPDVDGYRLKPLNSSGHERA